MNTAHLESLAEDLGRQKLALEVVRWLNQNLQHIPHESQVELLRILGVPIV